MRRTRLLIATAAAVVGLVLAGLFAGPVAWWAFRVRQELDRGDAVEAVRAYRRYVLARGSDDHALLRRLCAVLVADAIRRDASWIEDGALRIDESEVTAALTERMPGLPTGQFAVAATHLAAGGDGKALARLRGQVVGQDPEAVPRSVVMALVTLREPAVLAWARTVIDRGLGPVEPAVRVIGALGGLEDEARLRALRARHGPVGPGDAWDPELRQAVIEAVARFALRHPDRRELAFEVLEPALAHDDADVIAAAAEGLLRIDGGHEGARAAFRALLEPPHRAPTGELSPPGLHAAIALDRLGEDRGLELIRAHVGALTIEDIPPIRVLQYLAWERSPPDRSVAPWVRDHGALLDPGTACDLLGATGEASDIAGLRVRIDPEPAADGAAWPEESVRAAAAIIQILDREEGRRP